MDIPNEILSKCRYYHGEEQYPGGGSKYHLAFWIGEQFYCQNYADNDVMVRVVADYRGYFPDDNKDESKIDEFIRASMFAAYFHNFINDPEEYAMAFRSKVIPDYLTGSTSMKM